MLARAVRIYIYIYIHICAYICIYTHTIVITGRDASHVRVYVTVYSWLLKPSHLQSLAGLALVAPMIVVVKLWIFFLGTVAALPNIKVSITSRHRLTHVPVS